MKHPLDDLDGPFMIRVALDDITLARLLEISDIAHASPASVIAAIIRDVLEDDFLAHQTEGRVLLQ